MEKILKFHKKVKNTEKNGKILEKIEKNVKKNQKFKNPEKDRKNRKKIKKDYWIRLKKVF